MDRKVLQALVVILAKKTQIKVDEAMVHMDYNIIQDHICYDLSTFISNEIKIFLFKIEKSNFKYSSYLWWLFTHQNIDILIEVRLLVQLMNPKVAPVPIDLMVPILSKLHGLYYEFMDKFYAIVVQILIRKLPSKLSKSIMREL